MSIKHLPIAALVVGLLACETSPLLAQAPNIFGGDGGSIEKVIPPAGCSLRYVRDGNHFRYTAPAKNFEEPIRIKFAQKAGQKPRPDIMVWADEINWHPDVKSGTATGRIIVDDQAEYRIETTYVEYNQNTGQIYCPRKTTIIQRTADGNSNKMVAESAILTYDENGISSARFDRLIEMTTFVPKGSANPLKKKDTKTGSKPAAKPKEGAKEGDSKVIAIQEGARNKARVSGPAE
ncbi:MAG: hypothetical protein HUU16_19780 [Candidatus Omnitrophica bacterium]|nr:hypothetical protein [bacterium]NUN98405.1 hypothetical protein [Candidatus Omnitrophota bacterium]